MDKIISKEFIKHILTPAEKQEIAIEMALKIADLQTKEDEKKAIMSDLKAQIDGLRAHANLSATKLNNGYEMRTVECEATPVYSLRVWEYRVVGGSDDVVKTVPMSSDDLQRQL